jgi:hypothetical protein
VADSWYLADLIIKIAVSDDPRTVVHRNTVLVHADAADQAFDKAMQFGRESETSFQNPAGKRVTFEFVGVAELQEIVDEAPYDGAELCYSEYINWDRRKIDALVKDKGDLHAFRPHKRRPKNLPDYASKEIVDELRNKLGLERPEPED